MPLDVQPLSRKRQWVTLIVMVGLLGASLGMAQFLVVRNAIRVLVTFAPIQGRLKVPVNESLADALEGTPSRTDFMIGGLRRTCMAFSFDDTLGETPSTYLALLWYQVVSKLDSDAFPLETASVILARQPALQTEAIVGTKQLPAFAMLRLAKIQNRIVAFSYSGQGALTDGDKGFFDEYCMTQIRVSNIYPEGQSPHVSPNAPH